MSAHHLQSVNPKYYPQALLQIILLKQRLREKEELSAEIEALKQKLYSKQAKHRRCDREIEKMHQCSHCEKLYASDVALRLHHKLKHPHEESTKTVKEKNESVQGDETEHLSESGLTNSRMFIEQN